jgi:hypothetical protein
MSELRKAAILVASLPEDEAVNLLSRLEPKQERFRRRTGSRH